MNVIQWSCSTNRANWVATGCWSTWRMSSELRRLWSNSMSAKFTSTAVILVVCCKCLPDFQRATWLRTADCTYIRCQIIHILQTTDLTSADSCVSSALFHCIPLTSYMFWLLKVTQGHQKPTDGYFIPPDIIILIPFDIEAKYFHMNNDEN